MYPWLDADAEVYKRVAWSSLVGAYLLAIQTMPGLADRRRDEELQSVSDTRWDRAVVVEPFTIRYLSITPRSFRSKRWTGVLCGSKCTFSNTLSYKSVQYSDGEQSISSSPFPLPLVPLQLIVQDFVVTLLRCWRRAKTKFLVNNQRPFGRSWRIGRPANTWTVILVMEFNRSSIFVSETTLCQVKAREPILATVVCRRTSCEILY